MNVEVLGPVPLGPAEAARYLAQAATHRVRNEIRRRNNPLKRMGL